MKKKTKSITPIDPLVKPSKEYPNMYYFRRSPKGKWSKDYYNKPRAIYYSLGEVVEVEAKVVGRLPYGTY